MGLVHACVMVVVCVLKSSACICQDVRERATVSVNSTRFPVWGFLLTVDGVDSPSTGGLQSPRVPQTIQDPAVLQHPEADLSRVGEGPARGLKESEVGLSQMEKGTSCGILASSFPTHPQDGGWCLSGPSLSHPSPPSLPPGSQI